MNEHVNESQKDALAYFNTKQHEPKRRGVNTKKPTLSRLIRSKGGIAKELRYKVFRRI